MHVDHVLEGLGLPQDFDLLLEVLRKVLEVRFSWDEAATIDGLRSIDSGSTNHARSLLAVTEHRENAPRPLR